MAKLTASRVSGILFSGLAAVSVGFITMTSFMIVFPEVSLAWGIAVFFAGCLVEADVYLPGVTGGFKNLFFKWSLFQGLFKSLEYAMRKQSIREFFKIGDVQDKLNAFQVNVEKNRGFWGKLGLTPENIDALKGLEASAFASKLSKLGLPEDIDTTGFSVAERTQLADLFIIRESLNKAAYQSKLITFINNVETNRSHWEKLGFTPLEVTALTKLKATQFVEFVLAKLKKLQAAGALDTSGFTAEDQVFLADFIKLNVQLNGPEFQAKYKRRQWLAAFGLIAALGTGIAFGAITFTHVASATMAIAGLGVLSATSPVWVFAVAGFLATFAAVAYFMMMYYTLAKAIEGDFIKQISAKLKATFAPKTELDTWQKKLFFGLNCFFKGLVLTSVIALCVIVTMATADAWFNSSERFFAILGSGAFEAIPLYATAISYALVWALFLPITALFSIESSGNSIEGFSDAFKSIPGRWKDFWVSISLRFQQEEWAQILNPFRLVAAILESVLATTILAAHVGVSGALPGEGASEGGFMAKVLPALPATLTGSALEALVDADYVIGGDHAHHDHDHDHDHDHGHGAKSKNNLNKGMAAGHDHNHNNGLTAKIVLAVVFIPKYLGFIWDSAARKTWFFKQSYADYVKRRPDHYKLIQPAGAVAPATPGVLGIAGSAAAVGKGHRHISHDHDHDHDHRDEHGSDSDKETAPFIAGGAAVTA